MSSCACSFVCVLNTKVMVSFFLKWLPLKMCHPLRSQLNKGNLQMIIAISYVYLSATTLKAIYA